MATGLRVPHHVNKITSRPGFLGRHKPGELRRKINNLLILIAILL
jgi:hypothetical protein